MGSVRMRGMLAWWVMAVVGSVSDGMRASRFGHCMMGREGLWALGGGPCGLWALSGGPWGLWAVSGCPWGLWAMSGDPWGLWALGCQQGELWSLGDGQEAVGMEC